MPSRKELKENGFFIVPDHDDNKLLHLYKNIYEDSTGVKLPYVASIKVKNNAYIFNDQTYKTLDNLVKGIKDYHKTLIFPAWLYDKLYDEKHLLERQLIYYLVDILGFAKDTSSFRCDQIYVLFAGATKIEISIKNDLKRVLIYYSYGGWDMQIEVNTIEEAMNTVNTFIMLKLSETFKTYIDIPNKIIIPSTKVPDIIGVKSNLINFDVTQMKDSLKERLKEILKELE